jgi:hypothetical protein
MAQLEQGDPGATAAIATEMKAVGEPFNVSLRWVAIDTW